MASFKNNTYKIIKTKIMENLNQHGPTGQDNKDDFAQPNDRTTFMTDLEKCMDQLESEG